MKLTSLCLSLVCGAALSVNQAQALITWTGASDNNFWNAGNWSGGAPTLGGLPTTDSLLINNASITGTGNALVMADGFGITINNSTVGFTGGFGAQGIVGGTANSVSINNSTVSLQFVGIGFNVSLLNSSALNLFGPNQAIHSSSELSSVSLSDGSSVSYLGGNIRVDQASRIFRTSTGANFQSDFLSLPLTDFLLTGLDTTPFGVASGGNGVNNGSFTITAVPEPTSMALVGLGLAGAVIVRRRNS